MNRLIYLSFKFALGFYLIVGFSFVSWAAQDSDNMPLDGLSVSVDLRHRIIIPQIIYLRIGSATVGDVDKVGFDLVTAPTFATQLGNNQSYSGNRNPVTVPLGNSNAVAATSNATLFVDLRANIGTVTLGYEVADTAGISNGAGRFIAYDEIEVLSDNADLPAPVLSNTGGISGGTPSTVNVTGNLFAGRVIQRTANWTFRYRNTTIPAAGTYNGTITYTAASP